MYGIFIAENRVSKSKFFKQNLNLLERIMKREFQKVPHEASREQYNLGGFYFLAIMTDKWPIMERHNHIANLSAEIR